MTAVAAPCAIDGLVLVNENAYCVPAATVWFVCTVSVSVPEVNAPFLVSCRPKTDPPPHCLTAPFFTFAAPLAAIS